MTKNITLAIDEELLRKIRVIASERRTSLNGLVRAYSESPALQDDERELKRKAELAQLREMSAKSGIKMGAGYKFSREDAYEGRLG